MKNYSNTNFVEILKNEFIIICGHGSQLLEWD